MNLKLRGYSLSAAGYVGFLTGVAGLCRIAPISG